MRYRDSLYWYRYITVAKTYFIIETCPSIWQESIHRGKEWDWNPHFIDTIEYLMFHKQELLKNI